MESSRQSAQEAIKETIIRLNEVVPEAKLNEPLTLIAVTPYEQTLVSTFGREVRRAGCIIQRDRLILSLSYGLPRCTRSTIGQW